MRAGNALLVTGIVTVVAALAGPTLAAEDGRTAPEAEVAPATEPAAGDPLAVEEPAAPAEPEVDAGRVPGEPEVEPAVPAADEPAKPKRESAGEDRGAKREEKLPRANIDVKMQDIEFKPKTITVSPGDEVTWRNFDTAQHNAVGQGGANFRTPLLEKGQTATEPFNDPGTFDYICTVHPAMKGTVVVRSSGGGGGSSGGSGGSSGGTAGTSGSGGSTGTGGSSTFGTGSNSGFGGGGSGSGSSGSLPNTGGVELPLLIFGSGLIVMGLLARAFHEYWIWR